MDGKLRERRNVLWLCWQVVLERGRGSPDTRLEWRLGDGGVGRKG